ncbi:MAG: hypothetical protein IJU76_01345 [Desulfovibrionaceae bacterium]|nr:hypothetical protein [Desulfovibrionaceae bacterium]
MALLIRFSFALIVLCLIAQEIQAGRLILRSNSLFVGECRDHALSQRIELTLLDGHYFVLRQIFTHAKRNFTRDMTGHWRQREGGSILTLENAYGLYATLTVGSENLYGSFAAVGGGSANFAALSQAPYKPPLFTIMGTLFSVEKSGTYNMLQDGASERLFSVTGDALSHLPKADALFVDAEIAYDPTLSRIVRVRSYSHTIPERNFTKREISFADFAQGRMWQGTVGRTTVRCTFSASEDGLGTLELAGPTFWLSVPYKQEGAQLSFVLGKKERDVLRRAEAEDVLRILERTSGWVRDADGLVLLADKGELLYLEDPFARKSRTR